MLHPYLWIVIVGGFVCFLVACGNGANDLANAFGTSYGSKVLTLLQIIIIATCCEFAGAVGLGSNVATTMSSGIASTATFANDPFVLMYGFLCALGSTFVWLLLATWKDLPVSSHHSIAGAIIGFALVFGGVDAVNWAGPKSTFPWVSGVVPIIISWFVSPILTGLVAALIYVAVRFLILQRKNAVTIAPYTLPAVVAVTFFLEFLFLFMIAASSKLGWKIGHSAWMAAIVGAGAGVLSIGLIPLLKRRIRWMEREAQMRSEETGMSLLEAMREILAGGRAESHADINNSKDDGDVHGSTSAASPLCRRGAGGEAEAGAGTTASTQRRPADVSAFGDGGSRATFPQAKELDAPREADGAVVHDDEDDDDDEEEDDVEFSNGDATHPQNPHAAHAAPFAQRRQRRPRAATGATASVSTPDLPQGEAPPHPPRMNNNSNSNSNSDTFEEEVFDHAGGPAGLRGRKPDKKSKKKKHMFDKDGNPYVFVDGLRLASNGGYYDAQNVRIFDPRAEYMFRYLQVFTAACTSLAHGSNDVSNSIGPFAAIFDIYQYESVRSTAAVPMWVLVLGGAGIVVGLATYGLNIMRLLGEKIALITPFRGFAAELATALVVSFATSFSLPISSTHCITGAVIGISMMDNGFKDVKWMMVLKMYFGWVFTLVITAILSACFFSQGINSPIPRRFMS